MTPRSVTLILGVIYGLLTALELFIGDWTVGDATVLQRTTKANLLHWAIALAMLGVYFAGAAAARLACRIAGGVFLLLGVWGLVSASSLGDFLGYPEGIPLTYTVLHLLSAAACLWAGLRRTPNPA